MTNYEYIDELTAGECPKWVVEQVAEGFDSRDQRIATLEQQNAELVVALKAWDALIQYNYSGSREAMSAMQQCAFDTKDILDKVKQP